MTCRIEDLVDINMNELFKSFKLVLEEETDEYKVESLEDGFVWSRGKSSKGAVIGALRQGIPMREIDISSAYVPIHECIKAVKE